MNLVPSSMLLRPIHIKGESGSDVKERSNNVSASVSKSVFETETSDFNEVYALTAGDSRSHKAGQHSTSFIASQNQSRESDNGPNRNIELSPMNNESDEKVTSRHCKCQLFDISLFKNPLFYIFTWSFLLSQLAYFIPTFHLVARAKTLGIDIMQASYLVSMAGKKNLLSHPQKRISFYTGLLDFLKSFKKKH